MTRKRHARIFIYFTLIVFATIILVFAFAMFVWFVLFRLGILSTGPRNPAETYTVLWFIIGSILIGAVNAIIVGKFFIKPLKNLSDTFDEISKGNFTVRVPENKSIKEVKDIAHCVNSMVEDLSQIETLREDFVVNVSHEFKTPIATIEGYATLLQENNLSVDEHNRYVQKILENSGRLSNLLSNALALSKLENQNVMVNKKKYRLDEQIRKSVLLLEDKWEKKNIDIDISLPACEYVGDKALLDQVWFNIIDNAIKYSNEGGKIKIKLVSMLSSVAVTISDNGCGISEEVKKHLFDKFYQGDTSRKSEGNGLGLAIVKKIVDLCDGEISVNGKLGKGTSFTVVLPRSILTFSQA